MAAEAHSLLTSCSMFEFLFYVSLLHEIFQVTSALSEYLQRSRISVGAATETAGSCRRTLSAKRSDVHFRKLWTSTSQKAKVLNLEPPKMPRKQTVPKKVDDGECSSDFHATVESLYRANFYEALDTIACQIETRFAENDLSPLKDTESDKQTNCLNLT